jgi:hypothetical protein
MLLMSALVLLACDRTPGGVMSVNEMADLIVDLQLADAYIESHPDEFMSDSSKLVIKESVFKRHHITDQDYDSSLVWYAHNPEDYTKAHDKAIGKLQSRQEKLAKGKNKINDNEMPGEMMGGPTPGGPTHDAIPRGGRIHHKQLSTDINSDSADLWQGRRDYILTQGARRGFITFDLPPDANKRPGDRYQLSYKLARGGNEFKVCLSVDYTDGGTTQLTRGTNSDGWVSVDLQSDTARRVRRVYGYVSYDIKPGHVAHVDSLTLMRTHLNPANYGIINAQRKLERKQGKSSR